MIEQSRTNIQFLDKLYGRKDHLRQLTEWYEESKSLDNSLVLVKGVSGMGKTTLTHHFGLDQAKLGAYFVYGKQDLSLNNPPYTTIIQAFSRLIEYWLGEPEDQRRSISTILRRELGVHNQVLMGTFPRLANLFDKAKNSDHIPHLNFKDRFNEALLSFANALGYIDQRIIVLLDDLQWADYSTIQFLKLWLSEGTASNVFWIGAFRDDEVSSDNWLLNEEFSLDKNFVNVLTIKISGFSLEVINQMISDVMHVRQERLAEFGEFLFQLTGGTPLYIKEALPLLIHDEVLFFDAENEKWDYDTSQIRKVDKSSRTLEFIIRKMEELSPKSIALLGIGSAIGQTFNVAILSAVSEQGFEEVLLNLGPAEAKGMIECISSGTESPGTNHYRFTHDKMQNAAYLLMSEEKRKAVHFSLGKTYASSLGYAAQDRNIYDIVNQYNRCASYFDSERDRVSLVEMNLNAGKKAKASSSFNQALDYFNNVIHTIESNRQEWAAAIVFDVYLEAGEAAYLKSDFVSSVMFYESALKYAETNFQKARVHHNFLVMYNGVSDMDAAWSSGLKALKLLGHEFPKKIGKAKVLSAFFKAKFLLRKIGGLNSILDQPDVENPEAEQVLLTLMELLPAGWGRKPELLAYIVLKGFEILLKNGNTPIGYFAVSGYGAILGLGFGKIEEGWEFVKLGGELTRKYESMVFRGRGKFGVYGTYSHLMVHVKNNLEPLEDAYNFSKGAGDYSIASYSSIILLENMFAIGAPLAEILRKSESYFKFLKRTANYDYLSSHKSLVVSARLLIEGYDNNLKMIEEIEKRMNRVDFYHVKYTWNLYHLAALVVFQKNKKAGKIATDILDKGYNALSSIELVNAVYLSIAIAQAAIDTGDKSSACKYLKTVKKQAVKINKICPENYGQILALSEALIHEIKGDGLKAVGFYQAAVQLARENGFVSNEAIFCERLGRLYLRLNDKGNGAAELKQAVRAYKVWGADCKVRMLEVELGVKPSEKEEIVVAMS